MTSRSLELAFIRHGESRSNSERRFGGHTDTPLSERGLAQAARTAAAVAAAFRPTALVSSDLLRARQTAEGVAERTGLKPVFDADLRERSVGELDGMRFADVARDRPEMWGRLMARDPDFSPPGGETLHAVVARMCRALQRIDAAHGDGRVVVVSHAVSIRLVLAHILGLPPPRPTGPHIQIDNCSISVVAWDGQRWSVHAINGCGHLDRADVQDAG
jgi:probable phosphoglycerate mutase